MRINRRYLFFGVIFLLMLGVLLGCVEKEPLDEVKPQEDLVVERKVDLRSYFPITPGMIFDFAGEGNEFASFVREIKFAGESKVQFHDNNGGTITARVYNVQNDKIVQIFEEGEYYGEGSLLQKTDDDSPDEVILQNPVQMNTTWKSASRTREIVGIDETVTVPAGTFYYVIKVKITSADSTAENYEYYAPNVGLILREFKDKDYQVTSKLKSYGFATTPETSEENTELKTTETTAVSLSDPELALLGYQLERQLRSLFQSAYESYINLSRLTSASQENFEQIVSVYQTGIQRLAVNKIVDSQVKLLRDYYASGEGEASFPTHEVVEAARVTNRNTNTANVALEITKYYPVREWGAAAHDNTFYYDIRLVKEGGLWKLAGINGE